MNQRKKVRPTMCHIICLWDYDTLQSSVTGDESGPCWRLLHFVAREIRFFFLLSFLFPSFIPGGIGSYYPSWNDFNRDTAIPRELSLPAATQSIANWTGLWFIENPLFRRNPHSTHINTHREFSLSSVWCVRSQVRTVQSSELQWEKMCSLQEPFP